MDVSGSEEDSLTPLKEKIAEYVEYENALENAVQVTFVLYRCSCINTAVKSVTK